MPKRRIFVCDVFGISTEKRYLKFVKILGWNGRKIIKNYRKNTESDLIAVSARFVFVRSRLDFLSTRLNFVRSRLDFFSTRLDFVTTSGVFGRV